MSSPSNTSTSAKRSPTTSGSKGALSRCSFRSRPRNRSSTSSCRRVFSVELFAADPHIRRPICMNWDERGRLWIAESVDYPNNLQAPGQGQRSHRHLRGHQGHRQGGQVHRLRRQAQHSDRLHLLQGRRDRASRRRTRCSQGHHGRRHGRRARGAFGGWGTGRHARRASNIHYGLDNWIWAMRGYSSRSPSAARRTSSSGVLSIQAADWRGAKHRTRIPALDQQQHLGPGFQRGRARLRLDRQRQPQRLHADPESLLRSGARLDAVAVLAASPTATVSSRSPTRFARSIITAATRPRRDMPCTRPAPIRKEYWNRTAFVTEPTGHLVGTFVLRRDGSHFRSSNPSTCWPPTTNGRARSWPRSAPTATSG